MPQPPEEATEETDMGAIVIRTPNNTHIKGQGKTIATSSTSPGP